MGLITPRANFRPFEYPQAFTFLKAQNDHHWTHGEIEVNADVMQYHTSFTNAEKHGIKTVLKLFTTYEVSVAQYWLDVVYSSFPVPEIRLMAQVFAGMEVEHALFYDKLNEALGLSTEEFYLSFMDDPAMKERMEVLGRCLALGKSENPKDKVLSLAAYSFVEGVVLYSSFAFLMSFQQPPKNKLKNVCTGLAYSVRDEGVHADADSWLCNTFRKESGIEISEISEEIINLAKNCVHLEDEIVNNIFSEGEIVGIKSEDVKKFVRSRADKKLMDLGIQPIYNISKENNPVASWFYKSVNAIEFSDFFDRPVTAYSKHWNFKKIQKW